MRLVCLTACVLAGLAIAGCDKNSSDSKSVQPDTKQAEHVAVVDSKKSEAPKAPTKWDGPLGVKMGLSVKDLSSAGVSLASIESAPLIYRSNSAPAPSSSFEDYSYFVSDEVGLCRIVAWTPEKEANPFGEQILSTFDDLEGALVAKYGKPKEYKFVQNGSIWRDKRDFMMGLMKEERTHATAWEADGRHDLPPDVESIVLSAGAFSSSKGYVKLSYEFKNMDSCIKEAKQKKHANL